VIKVVKDVMVAIRMCSEIKEMLKAKGIGPQKIFDRGLKEILKEVENQKESRLK